MFKCPHCEAEINHLHYHENATIYGSYDIETEDYDQDETEPDGGVEYSCPECETRINSPDDLINIEREEEEENSIRRADIRQHINDPTSLNLQQLNHFNSDQEGRNLPVPQAIEEDWKGEYSGYHNSHDRQKQSAILTCPKCGNKNEAIENETVECYECGKKINLSNAKEIIPVEKQTL